MARPTRQGVDYFPLDIHLDDKFKFIEIKYGLEGFAVIIKLLQKIYSYGYWYQWEDDERIIFAHENNIKSELLQEIIDESLKRDIFNKGMYDNYNILTSSGIQKRYKEIVRRRKDIEIVAEYLLVDNDFGVNVDTMYTSSKHNDNKSTQSKVKESKVNKSKVDDSKEKELKPPTPIKNKYGEFKKVSLTEEEHKKLLDNIGQAKTDDLIVRLDSYKASTGKTYKSDYATILNWHRKEGEISGKYSKGNSITKRTDGENDIAKKAGVISL